MYAAIRQVKAKAGKADELAQRIKGAVPIVEQAQESNRRALAWIEKNLGPFVIGPATATAGPVIVHSVP